MIRDSSGRDVAVGMIGQEGRTPERGVAARVLSSGWQDCDLISTDVFDTLLLRTLRSERARIVAGERRFAALLRRKGWNIEPDLLVTLRLQVQRHAFAALERGRGGGEVRFAQVVEHQLRALGLPLALVADRLAIEVEQERSSLAPNLPLAAAFRTMRDAGKRIVAVSDTTLPEQALWTLIEAHHGRGLVDAVYASSDLQATKRDGSLFTLVARREGLAPERILHLGDDAHADLRMARQGALKAVHLPQPAARRRMRRANAAVAEAGRHLRAARRTARAPRPLPKDRFEYGAAVFGPILAQMAVLIWIYAAEVKTRDESVLLFCSRGGIFIREVFERVTRRLGLPGIQPHATLMVSRLVAARAALLARHGAALDELSREFAGRSCAEVVRALSGREQDLGEAWARPYEGRAFLDLLFGETGGAALEAIREQNALFTRHLDAVRGAADRIVLCDTGLYASTQRLLAGAFPNLDIETVQLARANYKGFATEHFPRVTGLFVERDVYHPLDTQSCMLRYWQLIESLFEPPIPSVHTFREEANGEIVSNAGAIARGGVDPLSAGPLFLGALHYIDTLGPTSGPALQAEAEAAWARLRQSIVFPSERDIQFLDVGRRSVDFGRPDLVAALAEGGRTGPIETLAGIRKTFWREGAIARDLRPWRRLLLPAWELAYATRGLLPRP